ncbi:helix-turn-helix domain-containing protein [Levilactobacillus yiduensis]|uniref:helix-turn-helix domain-containing protein n=1 Tax=Levilactobacillus yiduensis TaxID=2953880 RepID=UPI000EF3081D|nr:helix-turn-helix transcriptional regulator [Levilactobacillus yiduensis]AYM01996.1 XRE family transcriptional regulator [Levilactobacillus brevis]
MTFGERLQHTRLEQHLTQTAVAEALHVTRQTISSWETGHSYPNIDSLIQLSDFYHLSLDTLLKENHDMADTLRKPAVFQALRPTIRNLTIINTISMITLLFADQLASVQGIFLLVACLNFYALNHLRLFASTLVPDDAPAKYARWRQRRGWVLLLALVATVGLIWSWWAHRNGLATDFLLLALAGWGGIFYAEVGRFRQSSTR